LTGHRRGHVSYASAQVRGQIRATAVGKVGDRDSSTKALIEHYARRMTIEQRLAEIIRAFCADALSSTVNLNLNLNVDLDIMLCVLAQALLAAFRARLGGSYHSARPGRRQPQPGDEPPMGTRGSGRGERGGDGARSSSVTTSSGSIYSRRRPIRPK
jgi:hypothetical protein